MEERRAAEEKIPVPETLVLTEDQLKRYARNIVLPEVGGKGQHKLLSSRVLVVGNGGLGSPCAYYLAAAGVGHIGLVDGDVVDLSNLQRQILHWTTDLGRPKPQSAKEKLTRLNPDVEVITYCEWLSPDNAVRIIRDYDVVVDATDNFPARYLMNDACVLLGKPMVHGSIFRMEGQASVFWAAKGPCYRCLYPAPPPPGAVPSCAQAGVLGSVAGLIGCLEATETIKILLGAGETLVGRLVLFNGLTMEFTEVSLKKNPSCPACGEDARIGAEGIGWFEGDEGSGAGAGHDLNGRVAGGAETIGQERQEGQETGEQEKAGQDKVASRLTEAAFTKEAASGKAVTLDLKGDRCPMTYIKSRIALDDLKVGDVLEILVDYEPATRNLPAGFSLQGQEVLSVERWVDGGWVVRIRRVK